MAARRVRADRRAAARDGAEKVSQAGHGRESEPAVRCLFTQHGGGGRRDEGDGQCRAYGVYGSGGFAIKNLALCAYFIGARGVFMHFYLIDFFGYSLWLRGRRADQVRSCYTS